MSKREELDSLQYGASVRCRGLRCTWFAVELLTVTAGDGSPPDTTRDRCTSGWSGLALRLLGRTNTAGYSVGQFVFRPTPRLMGVNHLQFTSHQLLTSQARFLMIRIGKLKTRHKLIESSGAQAACVMIEEVKVNLGRKRKQWVMSVENDIAEMLEHDPELL
ncbi:hypothetical protein [Pseudomonas sp. UMAB-40]|uniref:hypothetical protein n=1 Tax=Pseudomonas sp. UMAB-40 TaxID=1365407 RepID=UPI001C594AD5|nr:hypothetical protein [Pseudomonas sp. UMAB-40]